MRGSFRCLGIIGALIAVGGCAAHHAAVSPAETTPAPQTPPATQPSSDFAHLDVRPQAMASGTQTVQAGLQQLDSRTDVDSVSGAFVYVPTRCVGTRRAPLVVLLHGAGMDGFDMINVDDSVFKTLADSFGFILLSPRSNQLWSWYAPRPDRRIADVRRLGAAIRQVLRHYAIDPSRIALAGVSNGGGLSLDLGYANGDIFSRVIGWSPAIQIMSGHLGPTILPRHGSPPIFIAQGTNDEEVPITDTRTVVEWLRHAGYSVTFVEDAGQHYLTKGRAVAAFQWLAKSWQ